MRSNTMRGLRSRRRDTRITSGEHFDDQFEMLARQRAIRMALAQHRVESSTCHVWFADIDTMICASTSSGFSMHASGSRSRASMHVGERGGFDEILRVRREQSAAADVADAMAGAADALQRRCDRRRRLNQHDFVEAADVDAHLERIGCDDGAQFAGFEPCLHLGAYLARQRAVVRVCERLRRGVVDLQRDAFGQATAVREEQRRMIARDDLSERLRQRLPHLLPGVERGADVRREADVEADLFAVQTFDDLDRARLEVTVAAGDERRDLGERIDGGRQRDALKLAGDPREPLQRCRQHGAAPVVHDRMDLVENHRLHRAESYAPSCIRQHQHQAFGCRDQYFRRPPQHALAIA